MSSESELKIQEEAIAFAKKNRTRICKEITDKTIYLPEVSPVSVFMSGSPGAGKTETSKGLVEMITSDGGNVLRLDPDELRGYFSAYDGSNSYLFQRAVTVLVERSFDNMMKNRQSFILDGTMSNHGVARRNILRSINKGRSVLVIFVYQKPELAWKFVQAREQTEGRRILPEHFVDQFFGSQDATNSLKEEFGNKIRIDLLLKDIDGSTRSYEDNVSNLTPYLNPMYTREDVLDIVLSV